MSLGEVAAQKKTALVGRIVIGYLPKGPYPLTVVSSHYCISSSERCGSCLCSDG